MPDMTKQGYNQIIELIQDMNVEAPTILTATGLQIWIQAYLQCQDEIIDLITRLKAQCGR